jgi:GTPase Era involved in 16S rRNA processing
MSEEPTKTSDTSIKNYARLKNQILDCIDSMFAIENIRGCPCEELREKIQTNAFNLLVVGQFKRGKTSLINALLGADILPVAVIPLTSIVTIMTYGEALRVTVFFNDGRITEIKSESLSEHVTEKGNPKNIKDVSEVVITYPSQYLKDGVRLIDTPGVGSIYQHNTDVAYRYLPKCDAALFLLSVDQPMGKAEIDFLKDVKEYSNKIFFLLNKADYLNENDLKESIEFSKGVLQDTMDADVKIFPLSAKRALEGKLNKSEEMVQRSLLPGFSLELNTFLMEDKGRILILSVTNNLLRIISQARLELELELKSLTTPLDELKKKIEAFDAKKKDVMLEKSDFDLLLDGEIKRIIKNILDEDLTAYGKELRLNAEAKLEEYYREHSGMSLKELHKHLEEHIIAEVRLAFNAWRGIEDEKLSKAFETACRRFITKIDETVDSLLKFSSELFAVPFDAVKAEALWSTKTGFYYKFRDQPVGIEIVALSLTLLLPKFIGEKIILKKMKEYLERAISMQLGRIGYDFEKRLDKSKLDFRWEMLQRIEATIEGIGTAIEKGMNQRGKGEKEVEETKQELSDAAQKLNDVRGKLLKIKEQIE